MRLSSSYHDDLGIEGDKQGAVPGIPRHRPGRRRRDAGCSIGGEATLIQAYRPIVRLASIAAERSCRGIGWGDGTVDGHYPAVGDETGPEPPSPTDHTRSTSGQGFQQRAGVHEVRRREPSVYVP